MGYKLLGFVVWQGGRWYVRRRFPLLRNRRLVAGVAVAAGVGALVASGAGRDRTRV